MGDYDDAAKVNRLPYLAVFVYRSDQLFAVGLWLSACHTKGNLCKPKEGCAFAHSDC